jgi:hypothetical protein
MTPQQRTINCLKDLQGALRELITTIDEFQVSITKLPPPCVGPPRGPGFDVNGTLVSRAARKTPAVRR